jgi:CRISPR-associated protein Cas5t
MYGFYVSFRGVTASFREPGAHLYHVTLPLPPISTMIGLAGAALGKDFKGAWDFFKANAIAVGVKGTSEGKGIDLWRYKKMAAQAKTDEEKTVMKEFDRKQIVRDDILNREFLAYPKVEICYAAPEIKVVEELRDSFCGPCYALSLGSSDDIAKIESISRIYKQDEMRNVTSLGGTLLEGTLLENIAFDWEAIKKSGVAKTLKAPMMKQLIVDFEFDGEKRRGIRYSPFTFLIGEHRLDKPVAVFAIEEQFFPIFSIGRE